MDVYAHKQGSFSPEQERRLRELRGKWVDLLAEPGSSTSASKP